LILDSGVPEDAAQDQDAAQNLEHRGDLPKEEGGEGRCHHRLAELGGGHEGGGEVLQAPAEDAVAQNGGKQAQQQTPTGALMP